MNMNREIKDESKRDVDMTLFLFETLCHVGVLGLELSECAFEPLKHEEAEFTWQVLELLSQISVDVFFNVTEIKIFVVPYF